MTEGGAVDLETSVQGDPVARAFRWACITELRAFKPGNVSARSPGHGMCAADFLRSARAAGEAFSRPELEVGAMILAAIRNTRRAVACNTNLGIVLLCAPLARAARIPMNDADLGARLASVLGALGREDARLAFEAIRLAAPAGLGHSPRHDVSERPETGLLEAMRTAAPWDRIAYQYANAFADVLGRGLPWLRDEIRRGRCRRWATVGVYLNFLARIPDTHIRRKHGDTVAREVMAAARPICERFRRQNDPEALFALLAPFDRYLKAAALNPGTSADLVVATLFADRLNEAVLTGGS